MLLLIVLLTQPRGKLGGFVSCISAVRVGLWLSYPVRMFDNEPEGGLRQMGKIIRWKCLPMKSKEKRTPPFGYLKVRKMPRTHATWMISRLFTSGALKHFIFSRQRQKQIPTLLTFLILICMHSPYCSKTMIACISSIYYTPVMSWANLHNHTPQHITRVISTYHHLVW